MTTDQKIAYIQSFVKLIASANTYRDAIGHASFVRGILAAWNRDMTISLETFKKFNDDIEIMMGAKRQLPVEGDVV